MVRGDHVTSYPGGCLGSIYRVQDAELVLTMNPLRLIGFVDFWFIMRMVSTRVGT